MASSRSLSSESSLPSSLTALLLSGGEYRPVAPSEAAVAGAAVAAVAAVAGAGAVAVAVDSGCCAGGEGEGRTTAIESLSAGAGAAIASLAMNNDGGLRVPTCDRRRAPD